MSMASVHSLFLSAGRLGILGRLLQYLLTALPAHLELSITAFIDLLCFCFLRTFSSSLRTEEEEDGHALVSQGAYLLVKIHQLCSSIYNTMSMYVCNLKYHCKSFLIGRIGNQQNTHRSLLHITDPFLLLLLLLNRRRTYSRSNTESKHQGIGRNDETRDD